MDNGVQYYGLGLGTSQYMYEQLALQYTDRNNRVDVSNPLFHKIFEIYQETYKIIGRDPLGNTGPFMKDKNVAMFAGNVESLIEEATRQKDTLPDWDIVTFPHFQGQPETAPPVMGVYMVSSLSEHKDEAMRLIDAMLSKENTQKMYDQYMNPEFAKKNTKAVTTVKQSLYVPGDFDGKGNAMFNKKIREMNKDNKDINTVLREMREELQKQIDEEFQ